MSNIAYVRVSTVEQDTTIQENILKNYDISKWFIEKISAKETKNRPQLQAMMDYIREGDIIYVTDFSRLARSTKDLLNITEYFEENDIKLISIKENFDTSTPTGKLMLTMIGAINEFERNNILERQREGIELAKLKGRYAGRKPIKKPDDWEEVYELYRTRKITGKKAYETMGLKKSTFYKMIKTYGH